MHTIGSGDTNANRFGVRVLRAGVAVALTGVVCQGFFQNANGESIALTSQGNVSGNTAYVTLPQACYNVEGNFTLSIKLVGGDVTGTMRIIDGVVDNTGTSGAVAPTEAIPTYQEVLAAYEQAIDAANDVNIFESALLDYDSMVVSEDELIYPSSTTRSGVEFTKTLVNGLFVGHMEGTADDDIEINLIVGGTTTKPDFLVPGTVQYIDIGGLPEGVDVRLWMYASGHTSEKQIFTESTVLPVPAGLAGAYLRLNIANGTVVDNDYHIRFLNTIPTDALSEMINENNDYLKRMQYFNAYDFFKDIAVWPNTTKNGVKYSSTHDSRSVVLDGEANANTSTNIIMGGTTVIPEGFVKNRRHYAKVWNNTGSANVYASINIYSTSNGRTEYKIYTEGEVWVPDDLEGVIIQLVVPNGAVVDGSWSLDMTVGLPNYLIGEAEEIRQITNNYINNMYSNQYTIQAAPQISPIQNYVLESTGDTTDRTADIMALITANKCCRLGPGDFYVTGIDLPDYAELIGSGSKTRLILASDVASGYAVKLSGNGNIIKDMQIYGQATRENVLAQESIGTRHGILFQGVYSGTTYTSGPTRAMIEDLMISGFTGGGITGTWSGSGRTTIMNVCNCHIQDSYCGINLAQRSEYHKFTNITAVLCYYGCINNGGNNVFVNCSFSQNIIGFLIDNDNGQSWNDSHGSAIGCTFNHENNNTNGIAIKVLNNTNGFVFDGCQLFYGGIYLDDAKGIIVTGCNFGAETIDIDGTTTALFIGCMFGGAPSITIETPEKVKFVNCYKSTDGGSVGY